ncbi:MAG: hypothetical protein ABR588_07030 [Sphingomicrobium sp.]|nr:hypothetical protein [Sphingomonadales bacterium]
MTFDTYGHLFEARERKSSVAAAIEGTDRLMRHNIMVWSTPVEVYQRSKSVWIASGTYLGRTFEVKDRSERAAVGAWRKAAEYQGN